MYGEKMSKTGAQLSHSYNLTRSAAKRAGPNIFGATHDAKPRNQRPQTVETIPGTKISYVVPDIERPRQAAPTAEEMAHAERMR